MPVPASELNIDTVREGTSALDMANSMFGDGVVVTGATYSGDIDSAGIYSGGDATSPGVTPSDTGVILSTGNAEDFTNSSGAANQVNNRSTNTDGANSDAQFDALAGHQTYDASYLDIDFIPDGSLMTMQFVFSSEEYPEFQDSIYQDLVGVWVNGSHVPFEGGNGDVDPGNVNTVNNFNMFVDNTDGDFNTEMDGFTLTLTLTMVVNPGVVNSIRIGVADVADNNYDSNLLIAGDSLQTGVVALADDVEMFPNGSKTVDVLANDVNNGPVSSSLTITHINGVEVMAGDTITLPTGQTVLLNADGTLTLMGDGDVEDFNFSYTIDNGSGSDVGIVNATSVPCFVAGTMIATPTGERPVESLQPGDLVLTKDDGPQPLRWIGTRTVTATGDFAPIHIRANTFGAHRDLHLSPLHRVLIRDSLAEVLFGEAEVLVAARDLINDQTVRRRPGGDVSYVHLLFDRHQVVFSEGLETESFLPGPQTTRSFDRAVVDEICAVFPELDPETGAGYSPAARRTLKRYEANLWRASTS